MANSLHIGRQGLHSKGFSDLVPRKTICIPIFPSRNNAMMFFGITHIHSLISRQYILEAR